MAKADRKGMRKGREHFRTRLPDLGYYFIVTDTKETEENYMYGLRDSLPDDLQGRIVIKVSRAKTDKLVTSCKEQSTMEPQYGEPWIVFDRDRVVHFDQIIETAKQEGIHVGWSNPCIEIWFDAYFGKMHSYQASSYAVHSICSNCSIIAGTVQDFLFPVDIRIACPARTNRLRIIPAINIMCIFAASARSS